MRFLLRSLATFQLRFYNAFSLHLVPLPLVSLPFFLLPAAFRSLLPIVWFMVGSVVSTLQRFTRLRLRVYPNHSFTTSCLRALPAPALVPSRLVHSHHTQAPFSTPVTPSTPSHYHHARRLSHTAYYSPLWWWFSTTLRLQFIHPGVIRAASALYLPFLRSHPDTMPDGCVAWHGLYGSPFLPCSHALPTPTFLGGVTAFWVVIVHLAPCTLAFLVCAPTRLCHIHTHCSDKPCPLPCTHMTLPCPFYHTCPFPCLLPYLPFLLLLVNLGW